MPPERSDLVLTADIPHSELDVLVLDCLNIEACNGDISTRPELCEWFGADEPMVGIVVTISPSLSLYRIVVFPAASKPTIKIRISFFPHSLSNSFENVIPMLAAGGGVSWEGVWVGLRGGERRDSRT
jgi:hypothetical protein